MQPHLILKRGKKNILLVRYFEKLHFVTLDHRMNRKVKSWFLEKPRTEEEMSEKGIVRTSLSLDELRGVAAGGTGRGQVVQFYLKEEKRRYELYEDTDLETFDALFHGLESFQPPQAKSNWQDERLARQDPELRGIIWPIGHLLNIVSSLAGLAVFAVGFESVWITVTALLCIPASLLLYCLYPDYISIFGDRKKQGRHKGAVWMAGPVICPLSMLLGAISVSHYFGLWRAWLWGAGAMVILAALLYLVAPVFRAWDKLGMLVLVGILLSGGPVLAMNDLLDREAPRTLSLEVIDKEKHTHTKAPDQYDLTVILDGQKTDFPVNAVVYDETQIGETITVKIYAGAFGIGHGEIRP